MGNLFLKPLMASAPELTPIVKQCLEHSRGRRPKAVEVVKQIQALIGIG